MNEPTVIEQLAALTGEKTQLAADLEAANALMAETNGKLQLALAENAALADAINKAKTDAEAVKAFAEQQTAALATATAEAATIKAELEAAKAKLSLAAFGDIAGREPIAGGGDATDADDDLWAKYNALNDPRARAEFWAKHGPALKLLARNSK